MNHTHAHTRTHTHTHQVTLDASLQKPMDAWLLPATQCSLKMDSTPGVTRPPPPCVDLRALSSPPSLTACSRHVRRGHTGSQRPFHTRYVVSRVPGCASMRTASSATQRPAMNVNLVKICRKPGQKRHERISNLNSHTQDVDRA